jgi:putative acetyltransferase
MPSIRCEQDADAQAINAVIESAFKGAGEARAEDGLIVGHILFSPVTIEPDYPGLRMLGLAPLAVTPSYQGRGIGSRLVQEGLLRCKEAGYDAVVVLGHPTYYPRFGFTRARDSGLDNEYGADEAFMVVELKDRVLSDVRGVVKYCTEFDGI